MRITVIISPIIIVETKLFALFPCAGNFEVARKETSFTKLPETFTCDKVLCERPLPAGGIMVISYAPCGI